MRGEEGRSSPELLAALERAKRHVMTPAERFEQRVSFVYGQQDHSSGLALSKEQVREHLSRLYGTPTRD